MSSLYVDRLPQVLAADPMLVAFLRGFEEVGTALYDRPDEFPALFDPRLAPPDIVRWMAGWIGLGVDGTLPDLRCRAVAASAMEHFAGRGTAPALASLLAAATGGGCEVVDPGGIDRGTTLRRGGDYEEPDEVFEQPAELVVELETRGGIPRSRLAALLENELPAWLPYRLMIADEERTRASEVSDA